MKKMKLGTWAVVLACAMAACLGLSACGSSGPSDEEVITDGISATLDQLKTLDDATLNEIIADAGSDLDYLKDMGIDSRELFNSVLDGFDYSVTSVQVDGNSASANIDVTAKSFDEASTKGEELALAWVDEVGDGLADMTDDEINAKVGELVMQAINETSPQKTTVNATFTKNGDEWTCDDDLIDLVVDKAF